jgi:hypothetical protein
MDPVVQAALIGVGGSVIVAVVAFITTWIVTGRTVRADREHRVLDRELATYELALSELMRMQTARMSGQFSQKRPEPDFVADYFALRESASWIKAQGLLLAYAPQVVHDALEESLVCAVKAAQILDQLKALKSPDGDEDADTRERRREKVFVLFDSLLDAVRDADVKDQALANAIRAQLGKAPVMLALPSRPRLSS